MEYPYISAGLRALAVPIETLTLDPANARRHPVKNLESIVGSLKKFGQQKAIVVDRNGIVIAGNGTLIAARQLGWTHIAANRTELEGPEAVAFAIADNRTAELAEWDMAVLEETLKSLKLSNFDVGDIGFGDADMAALFAPVAWDQIEVDPTIQDTASYTEKVVLTVHKMNIRATLVQAIQNLIVERGWQQAVFIV